MHFFVHASAPAFAPLAPHLESLIHPFTVWVSLANDTEATNKIRAPASKNERNFRMSSSSDWFPHAIRTTELYHRRSKVWAENTAENRATQIAHKSIAVTAIPVYHGGQHGNHVRRKTMVAPFRLTQLLALLPLLGILLLVDSAAGQTPLLRLQRSRATLNLETNVVHAQGYGGLTDSKSASVFNYPNSLSCLMVYGDGKYVWEKREEATVGKPKVKLAQGTLSPDDLQHLKAILDDEAFKKITMPKPPDYPDDAITVREIESIDAQIDRSNTSQHFT